MIISLTKITRMSNNNPVKVDALINQLNNFVRYAADHTEIKKVIDFNLLNQTVDMLDALKQLLSKK